MQRDTGREFGFTVEEDKDFGADTQLRALTGLSTAAFYREVQGRAGPLELTLTPGDPGQPAPKVTLN